MAGGALGRLTVSLGLDAGEYISGLTKAELTAKQFANQQKVNAQAVERSLVALDRQAASLGKSAKEAKLFELAQKGATAAQLKAADAALTYSENFEKAQKKQEDLSKGAARLGVAIGAALSAAVIGSVYAFDRLVKSAANFQDLAEMTGSNAETLASFSVAAATAGVSVESIASASIKLSKSLVGVDDESKAAGAALAAIGINIEEFKTLDPAAQYEAVGKALEGYADGANKTAVAVALFGKSGAEQLKVFKALEEQGGRQKILTAEQIRLADEYADKQARASAQLSLYAQAVATEMLPAVTGFTDALKDTIKGLLGVGDQASSLASNKAIQDFAKTAAVGLAELIDGAYNAVNAILAVGSSVQVVAKDIETAGRLTPQGLIAGLFKDDSKSISNVLKEREETLKSANDRYAKLATGLGLADKLRARFDEQARTSALAAQENRGFTPGRTGIDFDGAQKKAAKDKSDEAEKYLKKLQEQLNKTRELNVEETLLSDIAAGRLKASSKVSQEQLLQVARQIDATKEADRVATARQKNRNKDYEDSLNAIREIEKAEGDRLRALLDGGPNAQLEKQRETMLFLAKAFEDGKISAEQFNDAAIGNLKLTETLKESKSAAEELGLTFKSSFEDAITSGKSLSDVIDSLAQDLLKLFVRKNVTEPLFNAVSGSGIFDSIGKLFGGGKAAGGPVAAGKLYRVNENQPEMLDVNGSQYLMMGSKGGTVRPGSQAGAAGSPIVINVGAGASRADVISAVQRGIATSVGLVAQSNRRRGPV